MSVDLDVDAWAELDEPEAPPLKYATLPEFVDWLRSWYRRQVFSGYEMVWCPEWWNHPEAVLRLEAVWRAYELLRHEAGTGISSWLRDHVDVHMGRLLAPGGPLERCSVIDGHSSDPLPPLPGSTPPEGWWTEADSGL